MGLTNSDSKLLFYSKSVGVSFESTLTLGRLTRYFSKERIAELQKKYTDKRTAAAMDFASEYSDELFKVLEAKEYTTMDHSAYEGATLIHDLNEPVSSSQHNRYSCVLDSGTLEHVFNFPMAIQNCMKMLKVGGHFIGITPCNNLMGHGFFQFSPELYYRVFSEQNGFKVKIMFVAPLNSEQDWYKVADPAQVKGRVTLCNSIPITLMVIAEKIANVEPFKKSPMQSDYSVAWAYHEQERATRSKWKIIVLKIFPHSMIEAMLSVINFFKRKRVKDPLLGAIDPSYFEKVVI